MKKSEEMSTLIEVMSKAGLEWLETDLSEPSFRRSLAAGNESTPIADLLDRKFDALDMGVKGAASYFNGLLDVECRSMRMLARVA